MRLAATVLDFRLRTGPCFGGEVVSLALFCAAECGSCGGWEGHWLGSYTASDLAYDESASCSVQLRSVIWNRSLFDIVGQATLVRR
jgi:hypothetical protein